MSTKLEILKREGIVEMTVHGRSRSLRLTPMGESVAELLIALSEIIHQG